MKLYMMRHKPTGLFVEKNELKESHRPFIKKPTRTKYIRMPIAYGVRLKPDVIKSLAVWYMPGREQHRIEGAQLDKYIEEVQEDGWWSSYWIETTKEDFEVVEFDLVEVKKEES